MTPLDELLEALAGFFDRQVKLEGDPLQNLYATYERVQRIVKAKGTPALLKPQPSEIEEAEQRRRELEG